ncbi:MAG: LysM peptidoglycan-binding domain-containing M23 family metallopeptidase [Myxococcales bacterium]|nr:LysM peptidoglycan-binding domain-containing M23 family metallopeptidase [Myxococcales bacterium]
MRRAKIPIICVFVFLPGGGCQVFGRSTDGARGSALAPVPQTYVAKEGDTLSAIAQRYHLQVSDIVDINHMISADQLQVGQQLRLPRPVWRRSARDRRVGDSPYIRKRIAISPVTQPTECSQYANAPGDWSVSGTGFIWPIDGVVLTDFGKHHGQRHDGLAIAAPLGTPVWASRSGRVIEAAEEHDYGSIVVLQHLDGRRTLYGSLLETCVPKGQFIHQGEVIGLVGTSGGAASPRLYFELTRGEERINPWQVLP